MTNTFRPGTAARVLVVIALTALVAACGRDKQEHAPKPTAVDSGQAAAPVESPEDQRMANAVATGKTAAPVDLKYDVLAKPEPGQPFEIELAFLPRLAADALEVEVTGITGFNVVSGGSARFEGVSAGDRHLAKVLVQADAPGVYYANVVARMITQVQTEARTFSVPVVVGSPPAVQKTQPQKDASGEAVQSMPAVESGGPTEPEKK